MLEFEFYLLIYPFACAKPNHLGNQLIQTMSLSSPLEEKNLVATGITLEDKILVAIPDQ